jgi:hypothetical protein
MAQPIWITPAGNLGTIPEQVFFQIPLQATDPDDPFGTTVKYKAIAGTLPAGIQLSTSGLIEGTPTTTATIQGVPTNVSNDVTSKFAIRAYTEKLVGSQLVLDRFADRTFTLTVAGQNIPQFVTQSGLIATLDDAGPRTVQINFVDNDEDDIIEVNVAAGFLPPGLTIDNTGLISGVIPPIGVNTTYNFSISITDGKSSNLRSFSIDVVATSIVIPYLVNRNPSDLGSYRSDNFFAYQFVGFDFDADPTEYIEYTAPGLSFPPGLQLDANTGWLYGYIPNLGLTELTYDFAIQVQKLGNPSSISDPYYFTVKIVGELDTNITWITPADLGTLDVGSVSTLKVEAVNSADRILEYRLAPGGVYNKLPQGLKLLPTGEISGRSSFNTFSLDGGATTFDKNIQSRYIQNETTFDLTFTFTVNAYSSDGIIDVFKTFTIRLNREFNKPYENLYIKAMPPERDRELIDNLLRDPDVFPPNDLYRPDDPYFGVARSVVYYHAYGLNSATLDEYVSSLYLNHYWKNLVLGQIETAQALDANGNVIYEVVYSKIIDNLVNNFDQSVSKQVTLPYPFTIEQIVNEFFTADTTEITADSNEVTADAAPVNLTQTYTTVYPNSLVNMRDQVIDVVGQISTMLPRWMTSKQPNGRVLGFTPAWVICYTKPGASGKIAYNIKQQYGDQLNRIDFEVDRYELDRTLSLHWDAATDNWVPPGAETTFDLENHYRATALVPGLGYAAGDQLQILGSAFGGQDGVNNLIITVQTVAAGGSIASVTLTGAAPLLSTGNAYLGIVPTNITGTGSGAEFDFESASGVHTVFDGASLRFEAPVDMYTTGDEYDKYLVFPKRTILA